MLWNNGLCKKCCRTIQKCTRQAGFSSGAYIVECEVCQSVACGVIMFISCSDTHDLGWPLPSTKINRATLLNTVDLHKKNDDVFTALLSLDVLCSKVFRCLFNLCWPQLTFDLQRNCKSTYFPVFSPPHPTQKK